MKFLFICKSVGKNFICHLLALPDYLLPWSLRCCRFLIRKKKWFKSFHSIILFFFQPFSLFFLSVSLTSFPLAFIIFFLIFFIYFSFFSFSLVIFYPFSFFSFHFLISFSTFCSFRLFFVTLHLFLYFYAIFFLPFFLSFLFSFLYFCFFIFIIFLL